LSGLGSWAAPFNFFVIKKKSTNSFPARAILSSEKKRSFFGKKTKFSTENYLGALNAPGKI
jgi:hypothetical protein